MTTQDATQSGVPENDTTGADAQSQQDRQVEQSPRISAMEAIAARRESAVNDEITKFKEDTGQLDDSNHNDQVDQGQQQDQLAAQLDADTPRVLTDGLDKVMVRIKVDGVESEVSVADMQRSYQKGNAADLRLQQATQLLNEAKTIAAAPPPVGIGAKTPAAEDTASSKSAGGLEQGKEFVSALFEGDEAKALEALAKLGIGRTEEGSTQIDAQQLAAQLTPAIRQKLVEDSALDTFKSKHADIVNDPYLARMADEFLDAELKGGKPFTEALEGAATRTRDWLSSKGVSAPAPSSAPAPAPAPTDVRAAKLERKAGIDVIPALNKSATTTEPPVQTASQIIAEMRKARGMDV